MVTWIVTIGNSDVQLKHDENWEDLYNLVRNKYPLENYDRFNCLKEKDKNTNYFLQSARVIGLVYGQHREHYDDLAFPLLDTLMKEFNNNHKLDPEKLPNKIIVILTDQREFFLKQSESIIEEENCPFWQDTITLESIFKFYFESQLKITPQFIYLKPNFDGGVDHWEDMLELVRNTLEEELNSCSEEELIYVSHQAGTPAISSAIQFVTISKFSNVQFLVGNRRYQEEGIVTEPQIISSSSYWRGLQIQKAKKLIRDGVPGAALELLRELKESIDPKVIEDIKELVDIFNIKALVSNPSDEFTPQDAINRVRTTLDLIEIFFEQENYIQGVTLLAAAQETFLKAAIKKCLDQLNIKVANIKVSEFIRWDNSGLFLKSIKNLKDVSGFNINSDRDLDLSQKLKFPVPKKEEQAKEQDVDYWHFWNGYIYQSDQKNLHNDFMLKNYKNSNKKDFEIKNFRLYKWLRQLAHFEDWLLLEWSCRYQREREDDRRNQLMHNLRGTTPDAVVKYLLGSDSPEALNPKIIQSNVVVIYRENVKKPFVKALHDLDLISEESSENKLKERLEGVAQTLK
ncbi:hypothetical protein [Limnoraphis robusta]|uniref:SIR2-like domain-containing protein n=1 Tax=Limnoraphis robusta CCNP1315 TaxID=3110306 RepID=A0ABU5TV84_9CYAN|nr:hypothetical protein [Limnoraphis robusta]MEA5518813.1 hypothetical protein [Limnoraphis robusta CCNP1315]MEA5548702.1 hypothetical protein [Limnoraphis robusta CCNP1324]